jgi:hypothetical protein
VYDIEKDLKNNEIIELMKWKKNGFHKDKTGYV